MITLDKFKVTVDKDDENYAFFKIGPLPRGYGNTVGNTLRRILLSSIPGAAITSVKIEGAKHEYSTLEGVSDDILTLVLKLKEISVKSFNEEPQTIKLNVKGKKGELLVVKASDFEVGSDVEIVNNDYEITELTSNVNLNIELVVEQGVGYAYPDESKRKELGIIPIDAVYSPVKRVKVDIVNTRYGQFTDLDQVNIEVYTDGTVNPRQAILKASEIYDQIANKLVDLLGGDSELNEIPVEEEIIEEEKEEKILVSQLNLSTRLTNALLNAGISDLRDLDQRTRDEVVSFRGMGKKSMDELEKIMLDKEISFSS